jgi:uncharacterized PurR-regulated membrane protein YhhQ (DUF165 family)
VGTPGSTEHSFGTTVIDYLTSSQDGGLCYRNVLIVMQITSNAYKTSHILEYINLKVIMMKRILIIKVSSYSFAQINSVLLFWFIRQKKSIRYLFWWHRKLTE